jgi:hypothetical protein
MLLKRKTPSINIIHKQARIISKMATQYLVWNEKYDVGVLIIDRQPHNILELKFP